MRISEIAPLLEMALPKKVAEALVRGLQEPVNQHVLKLLCLEAGENATHWQGEVVNWLSRIARIRLKPATKPAPAAWYFTLLFDEPFGGSEVANIESHLEQFADEGYAVRGDLDRLRTAARLRQLHERLATLLASGTASRGDRRRLVNGITVDPPLPDRPAGSD